MITSDFIAILVLGIVVGACAIIISIYGIYVAITENDVFFCAAMVCTFLFLSGLLAFVFNGAYKEYQNAIPQNHVKILKQKISDAENEYQKYLIDHPELKAKENYTK